MKYMFSAIFTREKKGYSVLCPELDVASQGMTLEEAEKNIKEAVELYIDDIPPEELELYTAVPIVKTFEVSHV